MNVKEECGQLKMAFFNCRCLTLSVMDVMNLLDLHVVVHVYKRVLFVMGSEIF